MGKAMGGRGFLSVALLAAVVVLAGCGSSKSSSTTGATATQKVKRLEVTVVRPRAEAPAARPFLARAAELLGWARNAEAAVCQVTTNPNTVQAQTEATDPNGKATLLNVPVDSSGIIPVSINCDGTQSDVRISAAPSSSVAVTVEVGPGKVEVKAKSEHVSQPTVSQPSQPSPPDQPSKPKPS